MIFDDSYLLPNLADQIVASREVERIKLHFARNLSIFHVTDIADNTLQILLQSVQGMSEEAATEFIWQELDTHPVGPERTALLDVVNNPGAVMAFSTLLAIPMFQDVHLINYNNLYNW